MKLPARRRVKVSQKRRFENEIREIAKDKRLGLPSHSWTMKTDHDAWVNFEREGPIHYMWQRFQEISPSQVVVRLEGVLGELPAVMTSHYGLGVALLFQKHDLLCIVTKEGMTLYSPHVESLATVREAKVVPDISLAKSIHLMSHGTRGLSINFAGHVNRPLLEANYTPEIVDAIRGVTEWVESPTPYGRIAIFSGPPGTGKSYAVRAVITDTEDVEWVLCPPSVVGRLASPDMAQVLLQERNSEGPLGIIVEDADALLRARDAGNDENVVSQLLNVGDGLMGDITDIRLILTTNCPRLQIDQALLRPGRLYRFIQFEKLDGPQARALYQSLTGRECDQSFADPISLSEVYALANDHTTHVKPKNEKFGQYM